MDVFVIVFVVIMAWGFFAAIGNPGALKIGDVLLLGLMLICCVAAFALFIAVPFSIIAMMIASAFA